MSGLLFLAPTCTTTTSSIRVKTTLFLPQQRLSSCCSNIMFAVVSSLHVCPAIPRAAVRRYASIHGKIQHRFT